MKAVLRLFFTGLLGLAASASAQTAPGDPAGNRTIQRRICRGQTPHAMARKVEA